MNVSAICVLVATLTIFTVGITSEVSAVGFTITMETDKTVYDHASVITVTGNVEPVDPNGSDVTIIIVRAVPSGIAGIAQVSVNSDGDFSTTINTASLKSDGTYMIKAQYVDAETGQLITTTSINTRVALQEQLQIATQERGNLGLRIEELTDSVTQLDLQALSLTIDNEVVAEVGPLRYLSNLTGWPMDQVVNIYALLLIFVFDPLAVSLVVAYNRLHLLEASSKKVKIKEKDEKKSNEPLDKPGQDVLDLNEEINEPDVSRDKPGYVGLVRDHRPGEGDDLIRD